MIDKERKYILESRLKKAMDEKGFNQGELAQKIGFTRQAISRYLTGTSNPPADILFKIADSLGVSSDYLLGLSDEPYLDKDLNVAQKTTGLTPEAIQALMHLKAYRKDPVAGKDARDIVIMLDLLLENVMSTIDHENWSVPKELANDPIAVNLKKSILYTLSRMYDIFYSNDKPLYITMNGERLSQEESLQLVKAAKYNELTQSLIELAESERS